MPMAMPKFNICWSAVVEPILSFETAFIKSSLKAKDRHIEHPQFCTMYAPCSLCNFKKFLTVCAIVGVNARRCSECDSLILNSFADAIEPEFSGAMFNIEFDWVFRESYVLDLLLDSEEIRCEISFQQRLFSTVRKGCLLVGEVGVEGFRDRGAV